MYSKDSQRVYLRHGYINKHLKPESLRWLQKELSKPESHNSHKTKLGFQVCFPFHKGGQGWTLREIEGSCRNSGVSQRETDAVSKKEKKQGAGSQ